MSKKNKKPSPRTVGGLHIAFSQKNLASVTICDLAGYWSHLTKGQIRETMEIFQEFLDYEPPHWIPEKGGLFMLSKELAGTPIVFMRLLDDLPDCSSASFSSIHLTGPRIGRISSTRYDRKILTPATLKDLNEA